MAHTYVVTSQIFVPGSSPDPAVTILGTVDGTAVTVQTWFSVINQPTALSYINAVTPLMLAAFNALQKSNPVPPIATWTV